MTNSLIEAWNISLNELNSLNDSELKILNSLREQYSLKSTLSQKQNDLLTKILKREFDLQDIKYNKMFLYRSYFYRTDYHGDYLQDSEYVLSPVELEQEEIKNLHAEQYNYIEYVDKYKFEKMVAIPENIKQLNNYANYYMFKFEKLMMKLPRARSIQSKYNIVKAIRTILSEEYDNNLIENVLGNRRFY